MYPPASFLLKFSVEEEEGEYVVAVSDGGRSEDEKLRRRTSCCDAAKDHPTGSMENIPPR